MPRRPVSASPFRYFNSSLEAIRLKEGDEARRSTREVVTDGLRSYGAAMTDIGNAERHEVGRWLNNRVENSHLPFRRRERAMQLFRQMKTLQKSSSVHAQVHNHFNQKRHLVDRQTYKTRRSAALAEWHIVMACSSKPSVRQSETCALVRQHPEALSLQGADCRGSPSSPYSQRIRTVPGVRPRSGDRSGS